jgi:hypothetical protein
MSPIHRMAAQTLISKGKWVLVDDSEQVSAGAPGTHSCRDNLRGSSNVTTIIDG